MIGVLVNVLTVLCGGTAGLFLKKRISERFTDAVMQAIGLCTICIGIGSMANGKNALITIASMVLGTLLGTLLHIDGGINRLGGYVEAKFKNKTGGAVSRGFVTASLLFCVGSMTVVGSLNAGLSGDNTLLFTKSFLDLISSAMLASALGIGVLCAAAFVLVFQGGIVLLAECLAPVLTEAAVGEMNCVGGLLILALGLNLLKITKIKVADMLPALLFAVIISNTVAYFG